MLSNFNTIFNDMFNYIKEIVPNDPVIIQLDRELRFMQNANPKYVRNLFQSLLSPFKDIIIDTNYLNNYDELVVQFFTLPEKVRKDNYDSMNRLLITHREKLSDENKKVVMDYLNQLVHMF